MKRAAMLLLLVTALTPAAARGAATPAAPDSMKPPVERSTSYGWDIVDHSLVRPATRVLDVARIARKLTGNPREAANVDENDQVRLPSTWWQPRLGFRPVTPEQMLKGPGPGAPAPGKWVISHGKDQGVTPGFEIKDSNGEKFLIKFDPPGYPDLANCVDVIGCRLLWAAGYNVSDDAVTQFRPEDLEIKKDATYTDAGGRKVPFTQQHLEKVLALANVDRQPDGSYRCLSSRFLAGKPLGPFSFEGRRKDDSEDLVPHELRRELRGFWVLCAWLNHADSRGPNSLDMWVTENHRSFVRHYVMDYNAILGAGGDGPRAFQTGTEYYVDFGVMGRELATAGLRPFRWEPGVDPRMPAVGHVEAGTFDPGGWRPDYPNPAFDDRTVRDIRWGVKILSGFTDEYIRAAVGAARYTDPRAAEYLTHVLIERRDKLLRRWGEASPMAAGNRR